MAGRQLAAVDTTERRQSFIHRTAFDRLRWEYEALPHMRLTAAQVQRLCGLDRLQCAVVVKALLNAGFLKLSIDGLYCAGDRI
jgi:hypothetical protein